MGRRPRNPRALGLLAQFIIGGLSTDLTVIWTAAPAIVNGTNGILSIPEIFSGTLVAVGSGSFTRTIDTGFAAVYTPVSTSKELSSVITAGGAKTLLAIFRRIALPAGSGQITAYANLNPQIGYAGGANLIENAGGIFTIYVDGVLTRVMGPGIHAVVSTSDPAPSTVVGWGGVSFVNADYLENILGGLCVNRVLSPAEILSVSRAVLRYFRTPVV
jgi:hypothetical protein